MPSGDGTGPGGMGPMTGRAAGFCAGYPVPGYANPVGGRGMGMGWGRGFRGGGFGRGRGFGWGRAGYGLPAYGGAVNPYAYGDAAGPYAYGGAPFTPTVAPQQELDSLKGQAEYFEDALDGIKKRIEELESRKSSKE
jgi:hypothetical protein